MPASTRAGFPLILLWSHSNIMMAIFCFSLHLGALKIASITTLVPISNTLHTYVYKISLFAMLMYCKHHLSPQYHPPHCGSADENKGRSSRPGLQLRTQNTKAVPFGRANRPLGNTGWQIRPRFHARDRLFSYKLSVVLANFAIWRI